MGVYIFYFLLILLPVLWIVSIKMLRNWKHIIRYYLMNITVIGLYCLVIFYSNIDYFTHDPYGLRKIFSLLFCLGIHTFIGFLFALYYKYKMEKK